MSLTHPDLHKIVKSVKSSTIFSMIYFKKLLFYRLIVKSLKISKLHILYLCELDVVQYSIIRDTG